MTIINSTRRNFLSQNHSPAFFKKGSQTLGDGQEMEIPILLEETLINNIIGELENRLNITQDSSIHSDVTNQILQAAAQIFTFLNFCPPKILKFYESLFRNASSKNILLALTNVVKVSQNAAKRSAIKILQTTLKTLRLAQFEKIEALATGTGILDLDDNDVLGLL